MHPLAAIEAVNSPRLSSRRLAFPALSRASRPFRRTRQTPRLSLSRRFPPPSFPSSIFPGETLPPSRVLSLLRTVFESLSFSWNPARVVALVASSPFPISRFLVAARLPSRNFPMSFFSRRRNRRHRRSPLSSSSSSPPPPSRRRYRFLFLLSRRSPSAPPSFSSSSGMC